MLTAIVGINWGDEGKGRMVDLLIAFYRAQGLILAVYLPVPANRERQTLWVGLFCKLRPC